MKPKFPKFGKPPFTVKKVERAIDTTVAQGGITHGLQKLEHSRNRSMSKFKKGRGF